jgi:thioredoxin 1
VSRARGRASLRCNAASKGIVGDGRVKLCLSKEAFDAANAEAGDNLVRDPLFPTR